MGYFDLKIDISLETPVTIEVVKTILTNCERAQGTFYSSIDRGSERVSLEQAMRNIEEDLCSFREGYVGSVKVHFTSHPDQLGARIAFYKRGKNAFSLVYYPREKYIEREHCRFSIAYEWHIKQLLLMTEPYKISDLWAGDAGNEGELFGKKELTISALLRIREYEELKKSYAKRVDLIEKIINNGKEVDCVFQPYFLEPTAKVEDLNRTPLVLLLDSPIGSFKLAFGISWLSLTRDSKEEVNDLRPYIQLLLALSKGLEILQFEAERGKHPVGDLLMVIGVILFSPIGYVLMYCYGLIRALVYWFDNIVAYFKKPRKKR